MDRGALWATVQGHKESDKTEAISHTLRQHIKKQKHHFADKAQYSQSYGFPSSHVQMWELDHKEVWGPKNWYFWIVVLWKTLEIPLD